MITILAQCMSPRDLVHGDTNTAYDFSSHEASILRKMR